MTKARFTKMKITGLNALVPDYPRSIDEDIAHFDNNPAKLARAKKIVGFGTRYIAPSGCTPTDLALASARRLLTDMAVDPGQIDAVFCVMQKPDYPQPGSSFIIHKSLGLPKTCACLDINQGCPGFVYALWVAGGLLESGSCRKILIVTGDAYCASPDLGSRLLYCDAGAAALVEYDDQAGPSFFNLGADGGAYEAIIIPAGGFRLPVEADVLDLVVPSRQGGELKLTDDYLDSLEVFNLSIREVPPNVTELIEDAGLSPGEIDFAAFQQTTKQTVDHIAGKSGLKPEQYSTRTFSEYGNQSSASVPGVLAHILGQRAAGEKIKALLCGYGIGAAWASCITDLDHINCPGVIKEKFDHQPSREDLINHWKKIIGGSDD